MLVNSFQITEEMEKTYLSQISACENFIKDLNKKFDDSNMKLDTNINKTNPLIHLTRNYLKENANLAKNCLNDIYDENLTIYKSDHANFPYVIQSTNLVTVPETRGMQLEIDHDFNKTDFDKYNEILIKLNMVMSQNWRNFVNIIKSISFIKFEGRTDTKYFSGSYLPALGSMHMCKPFDILSILECLTHESSHFWLDQLEKNNEFAKDGWTKNEYYSPWREDKRPINGVVHGIYVFSNVALSLNEFKVNNPSEEDSSLMARICDLISQVEQGIEEMKICPDVLKLGRDIQNLSHDNIRSLYEHIDLSQLDLSRKKISNRKKEKIANWN